MCAYQAVAQKWWALLVVHAKYHSVYDSNGHGGYLLVPCNREKVCSPTVVTYIIPAYLVNLKITMLVWPCKSVWLPAFFFFTGEILPKNEIRILKCDYDK